MQRKRYVPRTMPCIAGVPFTSAEEAWFWFMRCQRARLDGARFLEGEGLVTRPCEPDDLYRALKSLLRRRLIRGEHVKILTRFGWNDRPPDPRCRDEERPYRLWDEALDRLTTILRKKEIVE